jgi:hypothetical protein
MCTGVQIQKRMKKTNIPKKIRKKMIKWWRSREEDREYTRMILERLKAAQAAQKLEEILLADPQITQYMLDWRTEIRERDLEVWGPLTQDEEALLNLLEEYLV